VQPEEKDRVIKEIENQLKEAQHVIAHFFHDNKEIKGKMDDKVSDIQTPQDEICSNKESSLKVP